MKSLQSLSDSLPFGSRYLQLCACSLALSIHGFWPYCQYIYLIESAFGWESDLIANEKPAHRSKSRAEQNCHSFTHVPYAKSVPIKIGPLVRALTGHDFGTRHKAILEKVSPPSCSFCWTEEESFSHLLLSCPSFNNTRADIFGSYTADIIHSWTTEQVVSFLSVQSITDREA